MNKVTIEIDADIDDTFIKNESEWMSKIIDSAHKFDVVEIRMKEGAALEEIGYKGKKLLEILSDVCLKNNWPLTKFSFRVVNLVQNTNVWPNITAYGYPIHFLCLQKSTLESQKQITKKFGMFVGRSSWERLALSSYLFNRHSSNTIQTYRNYLDKPESMLHIDLDRLLWQLSCSAKIKKNFLNDLFNFISHLPLLQSDTYQGVTHLQWDEGATDKEILGWYDKIFCDVVCEKMITGQAFFPTEKSARPLVTKTPFLMMAAPNHIKNLRRMGFKSFSQFWDESYDYQQGIQRIEAIQKIIDDLAKLKHNELDDLYRQMLPILEHNHKTYKEITSSKLQSIFAI